MPNPPVYTVVLNDENVREARRLDAAMNAKSGKASGTNRAAWLIARAGLADKVETLLALGCGGISIPERVMKDRAKLDKRRHDSNDALTRSVPSSHTSRSIMITKYNKWLAWKVSTLFPDNPPESIMVDAVSKWAHTYSVYPADERHRAIAFTVPEWCRPVADADAWHAAHQQNHYRKDAAE